MDLVVAFAAASSSASADVLPYTTRVETLDNGLRVGLVKFPSPGIVAYYTLVRTGAREEVEPGHTGFAHLFEHMMFRGSKKFPQDAQEALVQRLGFDDNAWTSEDETVYTLYGPSRGLAEIMPREADRFQNLEFSQETLQTETKAVLGEYNKSIADPPWKMEEAFLAAVFQKHTYGHTVIGYLADIQAMKDKYDYSKKFFSRFYRPDNCIVFVVGDFDAERVMADVRKLYRAWGGRAERAAVPEEPPSKREQDLTLDWPSETQTRLMIGWRTPAGYQAAAAQELLALYLLGPTSRLHKDLVLDRQVVESLESWTSPHRDPRLFYFVVTLKDAAAAGDVRAAIDAAVEDLRAGRVDAKLLSDVKSHYRYRALTAIETPSDLASALARGASPMGDPDGLERLLRAAAAVDAKQLADFARAHLSREGRTTLALRPAAGKAEK
ncbi:MAG: pitrilysin family protein [Myxococcota bacterium]